MPAGTDLREQIGGVARGIRDAGFHLSSSNADLVDQLAMFRNKGVVRHTAQHINGAAFNVFLFPFLAKQGLRVWVGQPPPSLILV